jgi:hypothetical protein
MYRSPQPVVKITEVMHKDENVEEEPSLDDRFLIEDNM